MPKKDNSLFTSNARKLRSLSIHIQCQEKDFSIHNHVHNYIQVHNHIEKLMKTKSKIIIVRLNLIS